MSIFKSCVAVTTSITLACLPLSSPVKANPAVLAPAALCAGTAGIGCVLVGVGVVGSTVVYFIYQNRQGKKTRVMPDGRVFRSQYLEDPEEVEELGTWEDYIQAPSFDSAKRKCQAKADKIGATLLENPKYNRSTKLWTCKMRGGNS
jgi:hypothetical protein